MTVCGVLPAAVAEEAKAGNEKPVEIEKAEPVPSRFGERPADEAYGAFQRGLYITAHNLALPRAEAGDAAAQTLLGEIYSRGLGKPFNPEEALFWYEKAAAQGVPEAQFRYGAALLGEAQREDDDTKRAEGRRLMQAAADAGNGQASFNLAQLIISERPGSSGQSDAFALYIEAARADVPDAQYAVAQYYSQGVLPVTTDLETAAFWLAKAANGGFSDAQLEYGQMLVSGLGVERDLELGYRWVLRSARSGNLLARAEVAKLLWGGIGTPPDTKSAAAWYISARRQGLRDRVLEDFWLGLSEETQRTAIDLANELL
ncbi:MAG: tetratricopeptide repeat protein [Pseudomonadota bacterium]